MNNKLIVGLCIIIALLMFTTNSQATQRFNREDRAIVTVEALSVRQTSSTLSEKLDTLKKDDVVVILKGPSFNNGYEWYKIKFENKMGWVAGNYLEKIAIKSDIGKSAIVKVSSKLMLRAEPSVNGEIIDKLENGTSVKILSAPISTGTYEWIKIDVNKKIGYVASEWIVVGDVVDILESKKDLNTDKIAQVYGIDINRDQNFMPTININTNKKIIYRTNLLEQANSSEVRVVIDILDSKIDEIIEENSNIYPIQKIWISQLEGEKNVVRAVITLKEIKKYFIGEQDGKHGIQLKFDEDEYYLGDGKVINKVNDSQSNENSNDNLTNKLFDVERRTDDKEQLVFKTTGVVEYKVIKLKNPNRFVVDLIDFELADVNTRIDTINPFITRIRTSQFKPDANYDTKQKIVRVVFDLKKDILIRTDIKNGELICIFGDESDENIPISYENQSDKSIFRASIKDLKCSKIKYDLENNQIIIPLKENIENSNVPINDQRVVRVIYKSDNENTFAYIELYNNLIYEEKINGNEYELILSKKQVNIRGKTIIIDPGHGGDNNKVYNGHIGDSGAISPYTGTREKDLTLAVAIKLKEELKSRGYNIIMTREHDVYVDLYKRAEIANNTDASVFISIHFNTLANANTKGIMTLYCPSYESEVKSSDQYDFAKIMHKTLISQLNRVDKSIRKRPELVVIRETKMPAVLLELGFLTNKEEEALVRTEAYQQKAVKAIGDALNQYFINN